jgi:hypothetical protein
MPSSWDRWSLTAAAAGAWIPGLFLLRYLAQAVSGRDGTGHSALIGFGLALVICLVFLRFVWWRPYRSARAWLWTSIIVLGMCGVPVWAGTALSNSVTAEIGDDLMWSALWGLTTGAPTALAYGAAAGFLLGLTARAGGAQAGQSQRPVALAACAVGLFLTGIGGGVYLLWTSFWSGTS